MNIDRIRQALSTARQDGQVTAAEVDRIMLEARDGTGLDATERAELLHAADGFDDGARQRLLSHLSAMGQTNAWVNVEATGQVANIRGRYADLNVGVRGLAAKVGLFDNALSLRGRAREDGVLKLNVEGQALSVNVKRGDTAAQILEKLQQQLPAQVTGLVMKGDLQPWEPGSFDGPAANGGERAAHLMLYKPEALGLKAGEKPLRVVVTGYGAFMGITDNPSANMAQKLAELGAPGAIVEYRRLDVTTQAVDGFIADMRAKPPDVIISMGVTGGQSQVEERPENHLGEARDGNNEVMAERRVRENGPGELRTDLPVEAIDWALTRFGDQRAVFTSKSDANYAPDRSAYLCNYMGYNLASEFGKTDATTAGFIHVTADTPSDQMHEVLNAVVARQLDWRRNPTAPPPS